MILVPFQSLYKPFYDQMHVLYLFGNHPVLKKTTLTNTRLTYIYKCSIPTSCTPLLYYQLILQQVSA